MVETQKLDDLAHRLAQALPPGLKGFRRELEDNFRAILQSNLEKLDLVSREQFEASQALLVSTRSKLDRLEARLAELEARQPESATKTVGKKKTNKPKK